MAQKLTRITYEETFSVDSIVDHKEDTDGSILYRVKWVGYPDEDTWEPPVHLQNVSELILDYHTRMEISESLSPVEQPTLEIFSLQSGDREREIPKYLNELRMKFEAQMEDSSSIIERKKDVNFPQKRKKREKSLVEERKEHKISKRRKLEPKKDRSNKPRKLTKERKSRILDQLRIQRVMDMNEAYKDYDIYFEPKIYENPPIYAPRDENSNPNTMKSTRESITEDSSSGSLKSSESSGTLPQGATFDRIQYETKGILGVDDPLQIMSSFKEGNEMTVLILWKPREDYSLPAPSCCPRERFEQKYPKLVARYESKQKMSCLNYIQQLEYNQINTYS